MEYGEPLWMYFCQHLHLLPSLRTHIHILRHKDTVTFLGRGSPLLRTLFLGLSVIKSDWYCVTLFSARLHALPVLPLAAAALPSVRL